MLDYLNKTNFGLKSENIKKLSFPGLDPPHPTRMTSSRKNLVIGLLGVAVVAFAIALITVASQNYCNDSANRGEHHWLKRAWCQIT